MALGWVFAVEGGTRVHVHRDGQGVMRGGRNELGWVRIGESLTLPQQMNLPHHSLQFVVPHLHCMVEG